MQEDDLGGERRITDIAQSLVALIRERSRRVHRV